MSTEFENKVTKSLDLIVEKIDTVENRLDNLENKVDTLGNTVNNLENKVDDLQKQMNIIKNVNLAAILNKQIQNNNEQNKNHKELIKRLEKYEKNNKLEHSRLNYEICKIKANA